MKRALRHTPFPLRDRAKAFLRGLPKSEGLLQVAREGLKRDVDDRLRERYLSRIMKGGSIEDIQDLVEERRYLPAPSKEGKGHPYRENPMVPRMSPDMQDRLTKRISAISWSEGRAGITNISAHHTEIGSFTRSPLFWSSGFALLMNRIFPATAMVCQDYATDAFMGMTKGALFNTAFYLITSLPIAAIIASRFVRKKRERCNQASVKLLASGEIDADRAQARLASVVAANGSLKQASDLYSDRKVTSDRALDTLGRRILDGL